MENLKLISCRLYPQDIEKIEELIKSWRCWKRNTVICGVLHAIIRNADARTLEKLICWNQITNGKLKITIESELNQNIAKASTNSLLLKKKTNFVILWQM